jgi:Flp pilus assembly protein TadG
LRNQRGQGMVEAGISITVFVMLTMGIIEFGRVWMVGNMITQAVREGARIAAVAPPAFRDGSGLISNAYLTTTIKPAIQAQIQNVLDATTAQTLADSTALTQPVSGGVNEVVLTLDGDVQYIFNLVGTSFHVHRVASFRDEVRASP